jgi:methyl-accepting chemotaxis protein
MVELEAAWAALGPVAAAQLERLYIRENPFPEGERYRLTDPGDGSRYSAIHREFHPRVGEFLAVHEYHDVILVNPSGQVVYTSHKESDFATDLAHSPGRDTHLAEVVRKAQAQNLGVTALSDFRPYAPSGNEWALFIGAPVASDRPGVGKGVLVFQVSPERIGKQLTRTHQQRRSASTRILGDGYRILGGPPWIEAAEEAGSPDAEIRERALREGPGARIIERDGRRVLASWEPGAFEGIQWVILSEVDLAEVRSEGTSEERAWMVVTLLVWLAWGVLTLGRRRPAAMARHRI